MGYKTTDPVEVTKLQAQGYSVIGITEQKTMTNTTINGRVFTQTFTLPGLVYEFNFDTKKADEVKPIVETPVLTEMVEKKQRGNPNWIKKVKK